MKFLKVLVVVCFFLACSGPKKAKYSWPRKEENYSSLKKLLDDIEKNKLEQAVILVCSDSFPPCTVMEMFWEEKASLPLPFFLVDADQVPPDETHTLVLTGVSLELPFCFIMDGDKDGFIGNGLTNCTLALEEKLKEISRQ